MIAPKNVVVAAWCRVDLCVPPYRRRRPTIASMRCSSHADTHFSVVIFGTFDGYIIQPYALLFLRFCFRWKTRTDKQLKFLLSQWSHLGFCWLQFNVCTSVVSTWDRACAASVHCLSGTRRAVVYNHNLWLWGTAARLPVCLITARTYWIWRQWV